MHLLLWYSIYQIWGMVAFVNPLVLWLSFTDTEFIVITMMIHFVSPFWLTGVPPLSDPLFLLYILLSPPLFLTPSGFILPDPCPVSISPYSLNPPSSSLPLSFTPSVCLSPSLDGFRLLSWWGWWPVWRLGCLVSRAIRADVARRGRSELSASASPRVTFHGQLVSKQRRACRLSALLIVKINGNQSPHSTLLSLPRSFHISASNPSLSLPLVFLCCRSIFLSFPLMCFCSSPANGCCLAICYPTVQLPLHYRAFTYLPFVLKII